MTRDAEIAGILETCFHEIAETRMDGIPILNPAISVRALGLQKWNGYRICVLLTPWFMNVLLLPEDAEIEEAVPGDKRLFSLPAGRFEFIRGEEPAIGSFWACSLFSPVLEFSDQHTAEEAGLAAIEELLSKPADESPAGNQPASPEDKAGSEDDGNKTPRPLSRRAFLSGARHAEEMS
ncbi:[NiFe]-hydrogenase assembly chaperone HybE [Hoeflea sp. TYP-13]|uniref:[NiFe]-hydrogenase assembly chaperone HybE n=1 Tax=Hoeflea sp. TYP-13 TaxID=3230023 RepID=UPI0034C5F5E9